MTPSLDVNLQGIIAAGIAAPSADNDHRFRIAIESPRRIRISGPESAPKLAAQARLLFLLSFGAVLENMRLSALAKGLASRVTWVGDPASERPVVDISLEPTAGPRDVLVDAIPVRHTNRTLVFRGPGLTSSGRKTIEAATQDVTGCALSWLDDATRRSVATRLARAAETERFRSRELHEELFSCVRFDVGWSATCERGLPPGTLGVEVPLRGPFQWLRRWEVMRTLHAVGVHHGLGFRSAGLPVRLAPNVAAVSTNLSFPWSALEGGRALQRAWLALTLRGMAVQVFAAPAIYANEANKDVRPRLQEELIQDWRAVLPDGHAPVMLIRIGRAPEPPVRTGRPAVESFLHNAPRA